MLFPNALFLHILHLMNKYLDSNLQKQASISNLKILYHSRDFYVNLEAYKQSSITLLYCVVIMPL